MKLISDGHPLDKSWLIMCSWLIQPFGIILWGACYNGCVYERFGFSEGSPRCIVLLLFLQYFYIYLSLYWKYRFPILIPIMSFYQIPRASASSSSFWNIALTFSCPIYLRVFYFYWHTDPFNSEWSSLLVFQRK